jgi:N-acetyl sugar amidotransferase
MIKICTRCLYSSLHPLNITFDDDGICSGCRIHEEKDKLDWVERGIRLQRILENYRNHSGKNYDCVVPVSGAGDSYYIVHTIKKVYGLNPLLVTYNKHYNTAVGMRNLANLRTQFDSDIMTLTVNPETVKKITRASLRRFGSMYWHCLAGQSVYPVQVAVKFKIPLIIWGVHQGVDQVGMFSHLDEVEMTRKYRKEHDLMGFEAEDLISEFDGIDIGDVTPFQYPDNNELEQVGVRGIYLNNYIRWDSRAQHEQMIELYGYETAGQNSTFDNYNNIDCWNYSDIHDYIKHIKYGYGKITDHVCREIRHRRLSREKGLDLIERNANKNPINLQLFLNWIGITKNSFHYIVDQHRNPKIWTRNDSWIWERKFDIKRLAHTDVEKKIPLNLLQNEFINFKLTPKRVSSDDEERYILIGRGI